MKPRVSVVLTTLGRPHAAVAAVRSILASQHDSFEVIVVEQDRESSFGEWHDARLRVVMTQPAGASAARNLGAALAGGEVIAFTDDDCEVDAGWLREWEAALERYPEAGVILGSVAAGAHDPTRGFVPACLRAVPRLHRQFRNCPEVEVMGASMAVRREVWRGLGGFWEAIGPGKPIRAAEDYDLVVRALRSGVGVVEWPAAVVMHFGFRTWEEGRRLLEGYAFGTAFVLSYRLARSPVELARCLAKFWGSFRAKRSRIVQSAGQARGNRVAQFGKGLAAGFGAQISRLG